MRNLKELTAAAEWLGAQKAREDVGLTSEWNQDVWGRRLSCGTACCVAGRVALTQNDYVPIWGSNSNQEVLRGFVKIELYDPNQDYNYWDVTETANVAKSALGISDKVAGKLFEGYNSYSRCIKILRKQIRKALEEQTS